MGWTERQYYEDNSIAFINRLAIKLSADSKNTKDSTPKPKLPTPRR